MNMDPKQITDVVSLTGRTEWPAPSTCFFERSILSPCSAPITTRVHGQYNILHVCDAHVSRAGEAVGTPYLKTAVAPGELVTGKQLAEEHQRLTNTNPPA